MAKLSKNNPNLPDDDKFIDSFFDKIEKELSSIEMKEIVNGVTSEELEEKGFIGDKELEVNRNSEYDDRKKYEIIIEQNVKYYEKKGNKISDIQFESVIDLPDILPNEKVAHWDIKVENATESSINMIKNEDYLNAANVIIQVKDNKILFIAKVKGKLVLFNYLPHIIPSDVNGYCNIHVNVDRMQAFADLFPSRGEGTNLSIDEVINELKKNNITSGIIDSKIKQYLEEIKKNGTELNNVLVAEGLMPVDGKDAEIEFNYQKEVQNQDFTVLPDGRIDYHIKASIPVVKKGSVLARICPALKGVDGYDVLGNVIKANDGQIIEMVAGENVSLSKDGTEFIAECDGQVAINDKIINVFKCFYVEGDVDYRSGNIDFNGNIIVKGVVRNGFEIKASGDITVLKDIESANVIAGRDLKVSGGIICRNNNYKMICGRDLIVTHLQNATVEAQRDVYVGNSCVQSTLYCNGKMILKKQKGSIIGGEIYAMEGIDAKIVGNGLGVKTEIIVGNDYLLQKTANELKEIIKVYTDNQNKIDNLLLPFINKMKNKIAIAMDKKDRLTIIIEKRKKIRKNISMLESKLKNIECQISKDVSAVIKINEKIHPDVIVKIRDRSKKITEPLYHVCLYYDNKLKEISTGPY